MLLMILKLLLKKKIYDNVLEIISLLKKNKRDPYGSYH